MFNKDLFSIREMYIKNTVRFHSIPPVWLTTKNKPRKTKDIKGLGKIIWSNRNL